MNTKPTWLIAAVAAARAEAFAKLGPDWSRPGYYLDLTAAQSAILTQQVAVLIEETSRLCAQHLGEFHAKENEKIERLKIAASRR